MRSARHPARFAGQDPGSRTRRLLGCGDGSARGHASELPDLIRPGPQRNPRRRLGEVARSRVFAAGLSGVVRLPPRSRDARVHVGAAKPRAGSLSHGPDGLIHGARWKVSLLLSVAVLRLMITVAFLLPGASAVRRMAKLNSNVGDLLNNASGSSAELFQRGTIFGGAFSIWSTRPDDRACHHRYNLITDLDRRHRK